MNRKPEFQLDLNRKAAGKMPAPHFTRAATILLALAMVVLALVPGARAQGAAGAVAVPAMPLLAPSASAPPESPASAGQVGAGGAAMVPAERTVLVFGESIHYWDTGSGPVVVLLHGLGDRKDSWLRVLQEMSATHRVIAPDQIGFGKSDKPLLDYTVQTYVDFLNEFLHQLHVEKASLVGESLGGWIAALYAVESPSDAKMVPVEKLVLVDAAGLQGHKPVPDLNPSTLASMRHVMELVYYNTSWLNDALLRRIFTDKLSQNDGYTVHAILSNPRVDAERIDARLGEIKAPTLVVWGKQDQLIPVDAAERYASGIAGAKLVTYDNCGHVPPQEHTEEFVKAVGEFLQQ